MSRSSKTKTGVRVPSPAPLRSAVEIETIGWREWVALPELKLARIKAKIDTGARTSCLDALDVEIVRMNRQHVVRFAVPYEIDGRTQRVACERPLLDERWVTSSDGRREYRPVICTELRLFDQTWTIELTLTSRAVMGFRMLLGRQAIRRRFVVDPGRSFVAQKAARLKQRQAALRKAKLG